jgi:hypothetical protein
MEYDGDGIIALSSKMYYCFGSKDKYSSKGINQKQNEITRQHYLNALNGDENQSFVNKGFRINKNELYSYT